LYSERSPAIVSGVNHPSEAVASLNWVWRVVLPLDPARQAEAIAARALPIQDVPAAYVCRDQTCSAPITVPGELVRLLSGT